MEQISAWIRRHWPAVLLVVIGTWKTSSFVGTVTNDSQWVVRVLAFILYFAPFVALELRPAELQARVAHLIRCVLYLVLLLAFVAQALESNLPILNDGIEWERIDTVRALIDRLEEHESQDLTGIYKQLLSENGCRVRLTKQSKGTVTACQALRSDEAEVLNSRRNYFISPEDTKEFRAQQKSRVEALEAFWKKLPVDNRRLSTYERVDLSVHSYGNLDALTWVSRHPRSLHSQKFLAEITKSGIMLFLTLIVGFFQHKSHKT